MSTDLNIGGIQFKKSEVSSYTVTGRMNSVTMKDGSTIKFLDQNFVKDPSGRTGQKVTNAFVSLENWQEGSRGLKSLSVSNAILLEMKGTNSTDTFVLNNSKARRIDVSGDEGNSDTVILRDNSIVDDYSIRVDNDDRVVDNDGKVHKK